MIERKTQSFKREQGVILIVALFLLLAMTLIGVTAVDTSTLQSQMSRNSLTDRTLYQASLSEIQAQIEEMGYLEYLERITGSNVDILAASHPGVTIDGPGLEITGTNDLLTDDDGSDSIVYSGRVVFSGTGPPPSGYTLGLYTGMSYEVNPTASVDGTSAESNQTQGLKRAAPKEQD